MGSRSNISLVVSTSASASNPMPGSNGPCPCPCPGLPADGLTVGTRCAHELESGRVRWWGGAPWSSTGAPLCHPSQSLRPRTPSSVVKRQVDFSGPSSLRLSGSGSLARLYIGASAGRGYRSRPPESSRWRAAVSFAASLGRYGGPSSSAESSWGSRMTAACPSLASSEGRQ